jgi:hypothetical protein
MNGGGRGEVAHLQVLLELDGEERGHGGLGLGVDGQHEGRGERGRVAERRGEEASSRQQENASPTQDKRLAGAGGRGGQDARFDSKEPNCNIQALRQ